MKKKIRKRVEDLKETLENRQEVKRQIEDRIEQLENRLEVVDNDIFAIQVAIKENQNWLEDGEEGVEEEIEKEVEVLEEDEQESSK
mgnify:CR=1 FL=1